MTLFDRAARAAQRVLTVTGGEPVTVTPMQSMPNGDPVIDGARQPVSFQAIFSLRFEDATSAGAYDTKTGQRLRAGGPVEVMQFSEGAPGYPLKSGDRIARSSGEIVSVYGAPEPDGSGHVTWRVRRAT